MAATPSIRLNKVSVLGIWAFILVDITYIYFRQIYYNLYQHVEITDFFMYYSEKQAKGSELGPTACKKVEPLYLLLTFCAFYCYMMQK
jgi:fatty acid desaturase